jgi:dihydrofolate synthase/folylpolyglutamate synthase
MHREKIKQFSSSKDVYFYFESFTNFERFKINPNQREYRLDRIALLLKLFHSPHECYKTIHIAGTKGKGSTAAFIAEVLQAAGYKTGLYTSPHVSSYAERFVIDGKEIDDKLAVKLGNLIYEKINDLKPRDIPGSFPLTTFELLTLFAFLAFKVMACQYGVVETGIGGRLDATNVIRPICSIITPIELEHTQILGYTLEQIAGEKGGIIKSHTPVFVGRQHEKVKRVLKSICRKRKSPCVLLEEEIEDLTSRTNRKETTFTIKLKHKEEETFRLSMPGGHQAENACLAYLALINILPQIEMDAYRKGFVKATLPGRFEIFSLKSPLVLDGAHTALAVKNVVKTFKDLFTQKGILIFGSVIDKDPAMMAQYLAPGFSHIIISRPGTFKQSSPEELFRLFSKLNKNTVLCLEPEEALEKALILSKGHIPILVTGSFYMVAEIRKLIKN